MSRIAQVRFTPPPGGGAALPPIDVSIPDNVDPNTAAGQAEIRRLAEAEINRRFADHSLPAQSASYNVYVDVNGDGRIAAGTAERLGLTTVGGSSYAYGTAGGSPIVYNYVPAPGSPVRAAVTAPANESGANGLNFDRYRSGLNGLSYVPSDAIPGISNREEALSFIRRFESFFGDTDDDRRARNAIYQSGTLNLGDGRTMNIQDLYAQYNIRAPGTGTPPPLPDSSAAPGGNGTSPSDPNYTYAPGESLATRRDRLRDRMGNLDAILAILAQAIAGGNLDALRSFAILAGARTGLAVADVATIVADSMRNLNIGDDASRAALVTAMRDGNPTGPNAGTRAAESRSRIQEIQNQLQSNDQLRNMLMQSLRDNMSRKEQSDTFTDSILAHGDREASHYRWS